MMKNDYKVTIKEQGEYSEAVTVRNAACHSHAIRTAWDHLLDTRGHGCGRCEVILRDMDNDILFEAWMDHDEIVEYDDAV